MVIANHSAPIYALEKPRRIANGFVGAPLSASRSNPQILFQENHYLSQIYLVLLVYPRFISFF